MCNSINNQISTKSITELKWLCQLLFNLLASPHLTKQEAKQIISKLTLLKTDLSNCFDIIKDGLPASEFKDELLANAEEREHLNSFIEHAQKAPATIEPDPGKRYLEEIERLQENMTQGNNIPQSNQLLQKIIEKIVLTPNKDDKTKLDINVKGNFAGMLAIASDQEIPSFVVEDIINHLN